MLSPHPTAMSTNTMIRATFDTEADLCLDILQLSLSRCPNVGNGARIVRIEHRVNALRPLPRVNNAKAEKFDSSYDHDRSRSRSAWTTLSLSASGSRR